MDIDGARRRYGRAVAAPAPMTDPSDRSRPAVHLTPPSGWLSDPNGLVQAGGTFHACYQHHPHDLTWGPMHWGHATSTDLLTWTHQPIALAPGPHADAWSGSAVVDHEDSAGCGPGAIVVLHTAAGPGGQVQCLASSTDGVRFVPDPGGPVLVGNVADFRDPKVLRFDAGRASWWVLVLSAGDELRLYRSDDLRRWSETSRFRPDTAPTGVLETPDLFPLAGPDSTEHWVLTWGVIEGAPAGGSGTCALVGSFDGATFTPDPDATVAWVDHGADCYAAQSWSDVADGRRIWAAWLSNWSHADRFPATTWRGQLTIPRELSLAPDGDGALRLAQRPVRELGARRPEHLTVVDLGAPGERDGAVTVRATRPGTTVAVTVDLDAGTLTVAWTDDLLGDLGPNVARAIPAPIGPAREFHVVLDTASVEAFAGIGAVTEQLPARPVPWQVTVEPR